MNIKFNFSTFFALIILASLYVGWSIRADDLWVAEEGLGYALGITGATMMALLLLYPLRKRLFFMHRWLPVRYWFAAHMLLGVLGPVVILYHSNFSLGSMNSNVALFSMLTVSLSGLLGRFFYVHIHKGLYGRKIHLSELRRLVEENIAQLQLNAVAIPGLKEQLEDLDAAVSQTSTGLYASIKLWNSSLYASRRINKQIKKNLKAPASKSNDITTTQRQCYLSVKNYLLSIVKVSEHMVYERLFSWWHIIHIPLFFLLIISVIVHIIAVHMY